MPNGEDIEARLKLMDWNAAKGHENSLNAVAPLEHINCFNTETVMTLAQSKGLTLVDIPDVRQHYRSPKHFIKKMIKRPSKSKKASIVLHFRRK